MRLLALAALALACAATPASCRHAQQPGSALAAVRAAWNAAFGVSRPLAGQLVGIPHSPAGASADLSRAREAFAALVWPAAARARTRAAWDRYAQGLAELGLGRLDVAAEQLTAAAARLPDNAEPWSDLSALYLERAEREHQPHDDLLALSAAERALALSPGLAPAAFNRALAFDRLFLPSESVWRQYLALDSSPGWAAEARRHLGAAGWTGEIDSWPAQRAELEHLALSGQALRLASKVSRVPQAARELGEEVLLAAWGEAILAGRQEEAQRSLTVARALGGALAAGRGEWMIADAVGTIDRARDRPAAAGALRRLAIAHAAYGQGLALYQQQDFARAETAFGRALDLLRTAGSPFAGWAQFQLARCAFQHSDYDRVRNLLEPLLGRQAPEQRYKALQGRCWRVDGLVAGIEGRPIEALASLDKAHALFTQLGEQGSLVTLDANSAELLASLGRKAESWERLARALAEARIDPIYGSGSALQRAALAAQEEGAFSAALDFRQEQVRRALASNSPLLIADRLRSRAVLFGLAGDRERALRDVAAAKRAVAGVPDARSRDSALADIWFAEGRIRRAFDPQSAIAPLMAAAEGYRQTEYQYLLAATHLELGLASLALRQDGRAERELQAAAREVESQRGRIADRDSRGLYLGQMREVYEAAVEFEATRSGRAEAAFAYSEQYRGRTLLDFVLDLPAARQRPPSGPAARSVSAKEVAVALPAHTVLVEFAFAHGRLFTWVVTHRGVRLIESGLGSSATRTIGVLARHFRNEVRTPGVEPGSAALLYEQLFQPLAAELPAGADLVLAPDGPLAALPFAALRDRRGRYLIEEHAILLAPSASFFLAGRGLRPPRDENASTRALAIGDPAFDQTAFGELPRLPAAEAEAAAVARLLPGSLVLVGKEASAVKLLALAGGFEVLHFAGHAILNSEQPLLSQLLLAADPGRGTSGVLYARELLGRRFARTRLVLLSACHTADRESTSGQGLTGLSSVFLAAGVPAVIATLWDVEDQASSRLIAAFYRYLAAGVPAAAALRDAQLSLLASRDPALRQPAAWAGFELIGDSPAFAAGHKT